MKKLVLFGLCFQLALTAIPREGEYAIYNETGKDLYIIKVYDGTATHFPANTKAGVFVTGRGYRQLLGIRIAENPNEPMHRFTYDRDYPLHNYFKIQNDTTLSLNLNFTERPSTSREYYARRATPFLQLGIDSAAYVDNNDMGRYDVRLKVRKVPTPPRRTVATRIAEFFGRK